MCKKSFLFREGDRVKFDVTYFLESFPQLFKYVYITLGITVVSMIISFVIGIGLAIITKNKTEFLYSIARVYISFFRGTPLLVQLFVLYFGLPQIFPTFTVLTAMQATLIGLSLNNAAYLSEIIRGSLNAVESGQMDACLSVGMTKAQAMRQIIFPQAIRVAVPSLGNNFVGLLKESSLSFALGVAEILAQAKMLAAQSYRYMESYLAVAIVYWIITIVISWGQKKVRKRNLMHRICNKDEVICVIEISDLYKSYKSNEVLKGISLTVNKGEVVVIIGPSGSGKSTLLRCLNLLEQPEGGSIRIEDLEIHVKKLYKKEIIKLRQKTAMVFQNYNLFKNKTALQNITTPLTVVQKKVKKKQKE